MTYQNYNIHYGTNYIVNSYFGSVKTVSSDNQTQRSLWVKPKGIKTVDIILGGAGGGGGAGTSGVSTYSGGGGGYGGEILTFLKIPSISIPDTLQIFPGNGGAGGIYGGTAAIAGTTTTIYDNQGTSMLSCNSGGIYGGAATSVILLNTYSVNYCFMGFLNSQAASYNGTAGGLSTGAVTNIGINTVDQFICGGTGGGGGNAAGTNYAGGNITPADTTFFPQLTGGAASVLSVPGGRGKDGFGYGKNLFNSNDMNRFSFFFSGGTGGGASNTSSGGIGGDGGHGGPCCGGGGGGGGATAGGNGGNGGPGFVAIISYF